MPPLPRRFFFSTLQHRPLCGDLPARSYRTSALHFPTKQLYNNNCQKYISPPPRLCHRTDTVVKLLPGPVSHAKISSDTHTLHYDDGVVYERKTTCGCGNFFSSAEHCDTILLFIRIGRQTERAEDSGSGRSSINSFVKRSITRLYRPVILENSSDASRERFHFFPHAHTDDENIRATT